MTKVNHNYVATNLMAELIKDGLSLSDICIVCTSVIGIADALHDTEELPTDQDTNQEATDSSFDHRNPCFTLTIKYRGAQRVNLIKVIRNTFGIPLRDAKELVEVTDTLLAVGPFDKIAELKRALENCGSYGVEIEINTSSWDKHPALFETDQCYTLHYGGQF